MQLYYVYFIFINQQTRLFKIMRKLISLTSLMMVIVVGCKKDDPVISEYIVTFDTDSENEMEPASAKANEKVIRPANPVKNDFEFRGWYSDTDRQIVYDFESSVTADIALYAKWVKAEIFLIDFNISDLSAKGVKWDAETRVLNITSARTMPIPISSQ